MPPKISVIIPTYNRRVYVQEAIDSVLAQTYTDYEIIVVDDGSTDGTGAALQERYGERIQYIWQENQGESVARNRAINMATGDYIALLDSDDLWLPEKLEKQMALLQDDPDCAGVYCKASFIDAEGHPLSWPPMGRPLDTKDPLAHLALACPVPGSTAIIRAGLLDQVGLYDPSIQHGEDWDLWLRMAVDHHIAFIDSTLTIIRRHHGGQCWIPDVDDVARALDDHLSLLRKAFMSSPANFPRQLQARAIAYQYLLASLAHLAVTGEFKHSDIEEALRADPSIFEEAELLESMIVYYARLSSELRAGTIADSYHYIDRALELMPPPPSLTAFRLRSLLNIELGLLSKYASRSGEARQRLMAGFVYDPRWLKNRGLVANLLELVVGQRFFGLLRKAVR